MTTYTMDELRRLLTEGDPIIDPDHPERTTVEGNRITILGCSEDDPDSEGEAEDLRIEIQDGILYLDYCEHGTENWHSLSLDQNDQPMGWLRCETFEDLHTWVYEL